MSLILIFSPKKYDGLFFMGEMIDWDAPTGGFFYRDVLVFLGG